MKNGICPKCGSNTVVPNLKFQAHEIDPFVNVTEPEPPNRPFIWAPKSARSTFIAYVCGACGYSEFYAENFQQLAELHKKGFK